MLWERVRKFAKIASTVVPRLIWRISSGSPALRVIEAMYSEPISLLFRACLFYIACVAYQLPIDYYQVQIGYHSFNNER